jgi:DNA-binding MarR family transcriptional regulator
MGTTEASAGWAGPAEEPGGGGLGYLLMTSASAWRTSLARRLVPLKLTPSQFFVVATTYHRHRSMKPPLSQREIAERTGLDINVVSQVVRGLERRALLRRSTHRRDSRAFEVTLTEQGLALAVSSTAIARRLNDEFFADTDGEVLTHALAHLTHAI